MTSSFSTPRGDRYEISTYGNGQPSPRRIYITALGPEPDVPCALTSAQARELAASLTFEADRADEVNGR